VSGAGPAPRPLPALEPETAFFWTAGAQGRLEIARCKSCGRWQHPPLPRCPACGGEVAPQAVSGKGRVAACTVNHQAWLPGQTVPFVFAAVELVEQAELYVFSNVTGCPVEAVRIGMPVEVRFEPAGDVWLPIFQPAGDGHAG
jgi:uncharacterized OB-fold protein